MRSNFNQLLVWLAIIDLVYVLIGMHSVAATPDTHRINNLNNQPHQKAVRLISQFLTQNISNKKLNTFILFILYVDIN